MAPEPADPRLTALLLLGPTGSGKTPVGRALERIAGWPHLDFGAHLRQIAGSGDDHGLDPAERDYVRALVAGNALFPDDALPLVRRIVAHALAVAPAGAARVVLNGVPRTLAQARGLVDLLDVRHVVLLACAPGVAAARVALRRAGQGPDDAGRADDDPAQVAHKLELFARETLPLVAHYRAAGATIVEAEVGVDIGDEELARHLLARLS
ncbi:MAG: nucleoside monophosphate kinase [Acidobacteria bacterium]|nr:nucleoside monophosphate kinase [Acidobacteriota bacterium]